MFLCSVVACKPATDASLCGRNFNRCTVNRYKGCRFSKAPSDAWIGFVDQYIEDYLATHPGFAVVQGRHEYDGQLQDWSAQGLEREVVRLKQAREQALAFSDEELGGREIPEGVPAGCDDRALFWLDKAEWPL